jgi:autotransporter-associated beta strand protein
MARFTLIVILAGVFAACFSPAAGAFNLTVSSSAATSNVTETSGKVFTATASPAVINISDLIATNYFTIRTDANPTHTGTLTINAWPTAVEVDEAIFEAGQIVVNANNAAANYDDVADLVFKAPTTIATSTLTGDDITFSAAAPVTLSAANVTLNATSSLSANSTINGASALTIGGTPSTVDLTGPIGATTPLSSISRTSGTTKLRNDVTTTGAQSYSKVQALDAGGLGITSTAGVVGVSNGIIGAPNAATISANSLTLSSATTTLGSLAVLAPSTSIYGGTVSTTGAQSYSGSVAINGTTSLESPALSIPSGTLSIGSTFTLNVNGGGTIGAVVTAAGSLTKLGDGQLALLGNNTSSGTMRVSGGALSIFGSQPNAAVVLGSGQLFGTGTLGAVSPGPGSTSLNPGGVTAPTVGTLKTGALTFSSLNTAALELNGDSHDQVDVTGAVTLASAALTLSVSGTPTPGTAQVLIKNDGVDPIAGTFAGLAEGAAVSAGGFDFKVSYLGGDGNDFAITRPAVIPPLETIIPPVVVTPVASAADFKLASSTIKISKSSGKGAGKVTCMLPAGTCSLKGSVYLAGKTKPGKKLGSVTASVAAGTTGKLTIKLSSSGKKLLKSKRKLKAIAVMKLVVPAGSLDVSPKITLKL